MELFRENEKKYKIKIGNIRNNEHDYSQFIISHEDKYYLYSEATEEKNNHHNRLGMILELIPKENNNGIDSSKISLASYFECINLLEDFQKKSYSGNYSGDSFISNSASKISSFFK